MAKQYRSVERVYGVDANGIDFLKYPVGALIPEDEARRQGLVEAETAKVTAPAGDGAAEGQKVAAPGASAPVPAQRVTVPKAAAKAPAKKAAVKKAPPRRPSTK